MASNAGKQLKAMLRASLAAVCLLACTVQVPSDIIQKEEMEDLLYDYHLMQAMAGDLPTSDRYKRKLYEQYVFDKHGVTEAEFDSSLAWYMRHTRELEGVYKNLNRRLLDRQKALEAYVRPEERSNRISKAGDSVNVWEDFRLCRLTTSPSSNRMMFSIPADSNFHPHDRFEWKIKAHFMEDTSRVRAVMALTIFYDKDTVGHAITIDSSGDYVMTLQGDSLAKFKEMNGFIHYYPIDGTYTHSKKLEAYYDELAADDTLASPMPQGLLPSALDYADLLVTDIAMMRYHYVDTLKNSPQANVETISVDSLMNMEEANDTLKEANTNKALSK